jgi:hypothetical protein
VVGPGVTPNILGTVGDPGTWDPNDPAKVRFESEMKQRQLYLSRGDKFCPNQV